MTPAVLSAPPPTDGGTAKTGREFPPGRSFHVARNPCVVALLEDALDCAILLPEEPDAVGALGAALHARNLPE